MSVRSGFLAALVTGWFAVAGASPSQAVLRYISPGDVLEILIYANGEKQDQVTTTVLADGSITLPLIGGVKVIRQTVPEVAQKLQTSFARGYYVRPQVIVNIKQYGGRVFISGEVKSPGMYPLGEGLSALSACVVAGGFTDFASPGRAKVSRVTNGRPTMYRIDLAKVRKGKMKDLPLQDGDVVEVPRRLF